MQRLSDLTLPVSSRRTALDRQGRDYKILPKVFSFRPKQKSGEVVQKMFSKATGITICPMFRSLSVRMIPTAGPYHQSGFGHSGQRLVDKTGESQVHLDLVNQDQP